MKLDWPKIYTGVTISGPGINGDLEESIATNLDRDDYEEWKAIAECHRVVGAEVTDVRISTYNSVDLKLSFDEFEHYFGHLF